MKPNLLLTDTKLNKIVQLIAFEYGYKWSGDLGQEINFLDEKGHNYDGNTKLIYYNGHNDTEINENNTLFTDCLNTIYKWFEYHNKKEEEVVLNNQYTAVVTTDKVTVNCQEFPISIIDDLVKARDKVNKKD